jgi:hypothetical protein
MRTVSVQESDLQPTTEYKALARIKDIREGPSDTWEFEIDTSIAYHFQATFHSSRAAIRIHKGNYTGKILVTLTRDNSRVDNARLQDRFFLVQCVLDGNTVPRFSKDNQGGSASCSFRDTAAFSIGANQ